MTSKMKKQLVNDVVTGLAIAALFAMASPDAAYATNLNDAVRDAQNTIADPFAKTVSYISYVMGAVMMIAGIAGVKKHADQPARPHLDQQNQHAAGPMTAHGELGVSL